MTSTAVLHPAFAVENERSDLRSMTSEEMRDVEGGNWFKAASLGWRIGALAGGVVGAAIGAAIVGGIVYAITH